MIDPAGPMVAAQRGSAHNTPPDNASKTMTRRPTKASNPLSGKAKSRKTGKNSGDHATMDDMGAVAKSAGMTELPGDDPRKRVFSLSLDAERKYVRRTAEEFAAGAIPSRDGKSQRLKSLSVGLSHPLHAVVKAEAELQGVDVSDFVRAALRAALRNQMDAKAELGAEVEIDLTRYPTPLNE